MARIRSSYQSLAPAERKVADYALEHLAELIYQSVTEVGSRCGVADATVMRFCQSVGFRGFQEFKLVASRDLASYRTSLPAGDITSTDTLPSVIQKTLAFSKQTLDDTVAVLAVAALEQAVALCAGARKVAFYGVGASSFTAWDARYKFLRIGVECEAYTDSHLQMMSAAMLTPQDVAVGFSQTGSTKDVVDCLHRAREAGAKTISVTDHSRSPVTQVSDVVLLTSSHDGPLGSGSVRSRMAQLLVLDVLFTGVALIHYGRSQESTEKTAESVLDKLY